MASSAAPTVEAYLDSLSPERRHVLSVVRAVVQAHLPEGYCEAMNWGMICYEIPLDRYPKTYNGQPLGYIALAAQKHYNALYLPLAVYGDAEREARLRDAFAAAGKKLDMGKSCLRFRSLDDLPLDAIGEAVAAYPPDALIARYEESRKR